MVGRNRLFITSLQEFLWLQVVSKNIHVLMMFFLSNHCDSAILLNKSMYIYIYNIYVHIKIHPECLFTLKF